MRAVLLLLAALISGAQAGTVLEWNFTNNLNDSSGQGLHGTWAGGGSPVYGIGPDGSPCIYFDGSHWVARPVNDPALRLGAFTIEAYIRPLTLEGEGGWYDFRKSAGGECVGLKNGGRAQLTIQLDGYSGYGIITPPGSIVDDRWVHVAATRDSAWVSRIYLNGVLQQEKSGTSNNVNDQLALRVGRCIFDGFPYYFHGYIDHLRVTDHALAPSEFLPPVIDCNGNGLMDSYDIAHGISQDCNSNGIPDECEVGGTTDCNGNGIHDLCDIYNGTSQDCNSNGIPDSCDIASGISQDCNSNGIPDACDITSGYSQDCNGNGIPDDCETGLAPAILVQPSSQFVLEGQIAALGVTAAGFGVLEYQWHKGGIPLVDDGRISGATTSTLRINPAQFGDAGSYDVIITNGCGSATSDLATLTVLLDPYRVTSLADPLDPNSTLVTLWQAINAANAAGGNVTITFAPELSGGTIRLVYAPPNISAGRITINGDINDDCVPDIELDGSAAGSANGLVLASAENVVRGLVINRFGGSGIYVQGAASTGNQITCCYVGTDMSGLLPQPNGGHGVYIEYGNANTVGPFNVIAFNVHHGVVIKECVRNTITRNAITGNLGDGIALMRGANQVIQAPYDMSVPPFGVSGRADVPDGSIVELFLDPEDEGEAYLGQTVVAGGQFVYHGSLGRAQNVTATVTDPNGNTSAFGHICQGETGLIADFEDVPLGQPALLTYNWDTITYMAPSPRTIAVTDEHAFSGTKSLKMEWQFVTTQPFGWLRLTTNDDGFIPNPAINYSKALRLRLLLLSGSFYLCMAARDTGTHACVGDDGGGWNNIGPNFGVEFLGATTPMVQGVTAPGGRLVTASPNWQTITFLIPAEPVLPYSGSGNGVLHTPNGRGTLESLTISIDPNGPNPAGPFTLYIDDIELIEPGTLDCNSNGIPDAQDIQAGTSLDCNGNGVPDECEWADCNHNGIPDSCEDCNSNGIADSCDIAAGTSHDCNRNGVPDECDLAAGLSVDLNSNGIPDECEQSLYFVDDDAPAGGNGTSWSAAFRSLEDALAGPVLSREIRLAQGTYKPSARTDPNAPRTATFTLLNGVAIYGGYAGRGAPDPDLRDPNAYVSTLSGDIGAIGDPNDNSYHVVTAPSGVSAAAVLDGVRITAGNANGSSSPHYYGGGVYCQGSLTLTNCAFGGNKATNGGGALFNSSNPTLLNCTLGGNLVTSSGGRGGGLYNYSGNPALTSCTFSGNSASGSYGYGGGLYNSIGSPTLANCMFSGNSAYGGGGLCNGSGNPTLTNCTLSGNTAVSGEGGGLYNNSANGTMTNCIVWGNTGGGLYGNAFAVRYSDIEGGWPGDGNIDADPLFVDADGPDNDPNTWTDNDYHLSPLSPCIDAGNNLLVPRDLLDLDADGCHTDLLPLDLDGHARIVDNPLTPDTGVATPGWVTGVVDMGAYEFGAPPPGAPNDPCPGDTNCDGHVTFADIDRFVEALGGESAWNQNHPGCPWLNADCNGDGHVTFADIDPFVALLGR